MTGKAAYLKREAAEYMKTMDLTQSERQELLAWVKDGNSVFENPWCLADERGRSMDYIAAIGVVDDLRPDNGYWAGTTGQTPDGT